MNARNPLWIIKEEVAEALKEGRPVVALESTLIAHGLPRPDNLELAREAEQIVREEGAVPATIAVIDGVARIGLKAAELELIARNEDIPKLGVRDLPVALARGSHGATTVASTSWLAAKAGIRLFATGGLGGVHREARESWDISADLMTLSRTPVVVISSGVKSILDVPATLEVLESLNVPVVGFKTRRFPGFYLTDSGQPLDWSVEDEEEAARFVHTLNRLRGSTGEGSGSGGTGSGTGGAVIANPIPPAEQLDPELHDRVLNAGLAEMKRRKIRGKAVTPFLLDYFKTATEGRSLEVNKRIIRNNARLAARIAGALARLESGEGSGGGTLSSKGEM